MRCKTPEASRRNETMLLCRRSSVCTKTAPAGPRCRDVAPGGAVSSTANDAGAVESTPTPEAAATASVRNRFIGGPFSRSCRQRGRFVPHDPGGDRDQGSTRRVLGPSRPLHTGPGRCDLVHDPQAVHGEQQDQTPAGLSVSRRGAGMTSLGGLGTRSAVAAVSPPAIQREKILAGRGVEVLVVDLAGDGNGHLDLLEILGAVRAVRQVRFESSTIRLLEGA